MRVAGFGFRKGASLDSLLAALEATGCATTVTHLATVDAKADAVCMTGLAQRLDLTVHAVPETELAGAAVETRSEKSLDMYGTGSVSEAAALVAAGPGAHLLVSRTLSADRMATCAIAESPGHRAGTNREAEQ